MPISNSSPYCLAVGEAVVDLIEVEANGTTVYRRRFGGAPLNVAVGVRRLGGDARLLGAIAPDSMGTALLAFVRQENVELITSPGAAQRTPMAIAAVREGRLDFTGYGFGEIDWEVLGAAASNAIADSHVVSLGNEPLRSSTGRSLILRCLETAGPIKFLDPNIRPHVTPDMRAVRSFLLDSLGLIDVLKLSVEDAEHGFDMAPEKLASLALRNGAAAVMVTRGPDGVVLYTPGRGPEKFPVQAAPVVDTTGAGDAFSSALITDLLTASSASQVDWPTALQRAHAVAALSVGRVGAAESSPTSVELAHAGLQDHDQ